MGIEPEDDAAFAKVEVGLRTARVTIEAKDGPPGLAPGAVGPMPEEVVVPGRGGNWGGDRVVGEDCLSASTDGGGWKLGDGRGRMLGR
jgi:hypothetical protein